MRLIILKDYNSVSTRSAAYVASQIRKANPSSENPFILGLPTGSTPLGMYRELIRFHREGIVSFKNVITFNMDEYVGIPENHPQRYHNYMSKNFFEHIDIPTENVNILDGNAQDIELECAAYERKIMQYGGVNLFVGGIGANGHIAFNEPGSSPESRTRVVTLSENTRAANSRFFVNDITKVPETALTVGIGTILDSGSVMLIVTGNNKAHALRMGVENGVNDIWPISHLKLHPNGLIVCSEETTGELKSETVSYYKEIEKSNTAPDNLYKD
ncbi:MAG: glucosamine-6-phosphate deaminase [Candidatus Latescibacteria bacterium]|jgi:glucosamine-6-phosphate deaminase|nr:glucosamine-6-phosphate deaminase [Candidatus Latescibacterota bacterium]